MLVIRENISKKLWNNFLILNNKSFLQSFEWGEFQKSFDKKIWRIAIFQQGTIIASAQIIKEFFPLKGKNSFYIPFGPCFNKGIEEEVKKECFNLILKKISELAKKENIIFLRIEPLSILPVLPENFNSKIPPKRIQPQKTLILDLSKKQEEIFRNFTYRVRYNIKLAERKGVKIGFQNKYIPEFYELMKKTTKRDKFRSFDEKHYKKLFDFSSDALKVRLCFAKYKGKMIAANILILFAQKVISLHGASDWEYRSLKAVNLLQWEAIKNAREQGYKIYDFWGVDAKKWPGLTAFKKSFGGQKLEHPQGKDVVFNQFWYWIYITCRKLLRKF